MKSIAIRVRSAAVFLMLSALVACGGRADPPQPYGSAPVSQAPLVTTNPADQTVAVGQTATFTVVASGTAPLSYQWQKGGVAIAGATGASYTTPATVAGDSGTTYQVVVSNAVGSVTSASAMLTVTVPTVVSIAISPQPQSLSVAAGAQASFSLQATCSDASVPTYQWLRSNDAGTTYANIAGATAATYSFTTASSDNNARFYAEASCGTVAMGSSVAILTVTTATTPPVTGSNVGPCYGTGPAGGWCSQNRNPVSFDLLAGAAANATTAWAIGEFGSVIKTIDGGSNWKRVRGEDPQGNYYKAMSAVDVNTVWAGSGTGLIIKTSDGGTTWVNQTSGISDIIQDIVGNSSSVAWAVGSTNLIRTTDGGTTWTKLTTLSGPHYRMAAPNATTAYVTSGSASAVSVTTDGGVTWTTTQLPDVGSGTINAISAPGPTVAWICADSGVVEKTTDGVTWTAVHQPTNQFTGTQQAPMTILALDAMNAYVGYGNGLIAKTADGGNTWTFPDTSKLFAPHAFFQGAATAVWGVGSLGSIYKTEDQGATFFEQSKGPRRSLYTVSAIDADNAWAGGNGGIVAKTSDGATWVTVLDDTNGLDPANDDFAYQVAGVSASTAYAAGGNAQAIMKTTDGGTTWSTVPGFGTQELDLVATVGSNVVWVAGTSGYIAKSTDGGATFTALTSGTTRNPFNIFAFNDQVAYVTFDDGSTRHTVDGGATWTVTTGGYSALTIIDATTVVAIGPNGTFVKSTDGGATFTTIGSTTSSQTLNAITHSGNTFWAVGVYTIVRSDDSGATWRSQPIPGEAKIIYGISALDTKTAWVVTSDAAIYKTTDGGD